MADEITEFDVYVFNAKIVVLLSAEGYSDGQIAEQLEADLEEVEDVLNAFHASTDLRVVGLN